MVHQVISKVLVKTRLRSPNWGNYCWKKYLLMPQSWYVYLPYTFVWVLGQGKLCAIRDLSEIGGGVRGVETEGGSQLFETAEKGGVIKNEPLKGGGSCKYANMCP